jgi:hypothetical protein
MVDFAAALADGRLDAIQLLREALAEHQGGEDGAAMVQAVQDQLRDLVSRHGEGSQLAVVLPLARWTVMALLAPERRAPELAEFLDELELAELTQDEAERQEREAADRDKADPAPGA